MTGLGLAKATGVVRGTWRERDDGCLVLKQAAPTKGDPMEGIDVDSLGAYQPFVACARGSALELIVEYGEEGERVVIRMERSR
jgi:hypothetical protein